MTSRDFCYWLHGFFELQAATSPANARLTAEQSDVVRRHLAMVFAHEIDPQAGGKEVQKKMNEIHSPFTVHSPPVGKWVARC